MGAKEKAYEVQKIRRLFDLKPKGDVIIEAIKQAQEKARLEARKKKKR